ncbi:MAG: TetR family transcriptional regulator [Acidobacteria bacterium]|nr:TetR family transcriptional regulator [Acidobacteriota bacterium]
MKSFKPPKLEKKRAISDDLKDIRRESILNAVDFLLTKHSMQEISMENVAETIKLAKGTLYLYFKTKEELFLSLLERAYLSWFEEIEIWVSAQEKVDIANFAEFIAESFSKKSTLLLLAPYSESILEKNILLERIIEYKRTMNLRLIALSLKISEKMPSVDVEKITLSFMFVHAAIVGLYFKAFPSKIMLEALKQPDLSKLKLDFKPSLQIMLEGIFLKLF